MDNKNLTQCISDSALDAFYRMLLLLKYCRSASFSFCIRNTATEVQPQDLGFWEYFCTRTWKDDKGIMGANRVQRAFVWRAVR